MLKIDSEPTQYFENTALKNMEMEGGHIGLSVHVNYIDVFLKQKDNYNIMTDVMPFKVTFTRANEM